MTQLHKSTLYLLLILVASLLAIYQWYSYFEAPKKETFRHIYKQCEKVYVQNTPHACTAGDLIFVNRAVAHKYCTKKVFAEFEDSVYCVYNGYRDDLPELYDAEE